MIVRWVEFDEFRTPDKPNETREGVGDGSVTKPNCSRSRTYGRGESRVVRE